MGLRVEVDALGAVSSVVLVEEAWRVVVDESLCWVRDLEVEVDVDVGGLDEDDDAGGCGVDECEPASESESSSHAMVSSGERAAPNGE